MPEQTEKSLTPTTTIQQDLTKLGQRRVDLIWESTQALIAVAITGAIVYTSTLNKPVEVLTSAFFLIIGFYFGRTNYSSIGGVGEKPSQPYIGR